ncbi:MAG: N-acetyl-gamma-glutamyl-phosphate reductase, partial [Desulfovibrio sp.]|nr:N-acetyl-gamma-glutamyl-phosphate reductase [Desulfovibrio sp.]
RAEAERDLGQFYPFLAGLPGADIKISVYDAEHAAAECELAFLAVPAGTALRMAPDLLGRGVKVIDFSADFRLEDPDVYQQWYGEPHTAREALASAVYGLPELNAAAIRNANLVANPGCYPTASILGLAAALKHDLVDPDTIIIDAASGASGAGRKPVIPNLYCEISDNFRAYGAPRHRHTPEIEQELGKLAGSPLTLTFTPHILPMKRGILATIYARLRDPQMPVSQIRDIFAAFWAGEKWLRLLPEGALPETAHVRGSMYCDIAVLKDDRTGRLIILCAIDNLCRGAAGQALANANLMSGLAVDCGMENLCPLP